MKRIVAIAAVLLFASQAAAQVSVLVQQQPQELPPPPAQQPEQIATPQPNTVTVQVPTIQAPTPWVWEQQWEAVPVVRWGFFGRRLVPRTLYRPVMRARPAQVSGPYYYYR